MPENTRSSELRDTLELFRKQCVNKQGGIGFEEAIVRFEALIASKVEEALRIDRLANVKFYKGKIDKIFEQEIAVYTEALQLKEGEK